MITKDSLFRFAALIIVAMSTAYAQKLTLPGGVEVLSQKQRVGAARKAGGYLVNSLQKDGRFIYEFSPKTGKRSQNYNWLRHCGSVMALCQLYRTTGDDRYLAAAGAAVPVFLKRIRKVIIAGTTYKGLISDGHEDGNSTQSVKTGGCALAAIALMSYDSCRKQETHKDVVLELCRYIRQTQKKNGYLRSKLIIKADSSESYYSDFQSMYYQGEALLALAMVQEAGRYPTKENQDCMLRLLNYLAYEWRAALQRPTKIVFDHWGMIGLRHAYSLVTDADMKKLQAEYLQQKSESVEALQKRLKTDISRQQRVVMGRQLIADETIRSVLSDGPMTTDRLLKLGFDYCENELLRLIRSNKNRHRGSFDSGPGRTCPTATRVEGISAIGSLIMAIPKCPYQPRVLEWVERVDLARRFIIKCQYNSLDQKRLKSPVPINGAVRGHLDVNKGDSIRIDYCQHATSALLGW